MSTVPAKHRLVPGGGSETAHTAHSPQLPRVSWALPIPVVFAST